MKLYTPFLLILVLLLIPFTGKAVMNLNGGMDRQSMQETLDKSERYIHEEMFDSAMSALSLIVSAYRETMPKEDKKLAVNAMLGRWFIYSMVYNNQSRAVEDLYRALRICEKNGFKQARIHLNYGCMYLTLATPTMDTAINRKAYSHFIKAMDLAAKEKDDDVYNTAFMNLITVAQGIDGFDSIEGKYREFKDSPLAKSHPYYDYLCRLFEGYRHQDKGEYGKALTSFRNLTSIVESEGWDRGMALNCRLWQVDALMGNHESGRALALLDSIEHESRLAGRPDMLIIVYKYKHDVLKALGNKDKADDYMLSFYSLKDSLENYQQVMTVNSFGLEQQIVEINETVETLNAQKRTRNIIIIVVISIVVVISGAYILLRRKNRQLNEANKTLYKKNIEALEREREQLEKIKEQEQRLSETGSSPTAGVDKYAGSTLSQQDKEAVMNKILTIVSQNKEIYSPEFSLNQLSEMAGISYKTISQVINEQTGNNFNVFINEFRAKEACRLINDPANAERYTLEHIGEMVGFKSRPSFNTAFKRYTGMTPSAYQKIVKENLKAKERA